MTTRSCVLVAAIMVSCLGDAYSQLQQLVLPKDRIPEADLFLENGVLHSTLIKVKFSQPVINLARGKCCAILDDISPVYASVKVKLDQIARQWGQFEIRKMMPNTQWGDTLVYNSSSKSLVAVPELSQWFNLRFGYPVPLDSVMRELRTLPEVLYAVSPDIAIFFASPDDPRYQNGEQWNLAYVQAPNAWDISKGSGTISVGVVECGVKVSHQDLGGKIIGGDGKGMTILDHGTGVSGLIAAATDNNVEVASLGWNLKLRTYSYEYFGFASCIHDAADSNEIINMSFGIWDRATQYDMPDDCRDEYMYAEVAKDDPAVREAIAYAQGLGRVLVAAAGNRTPNYQAILDGKLSPACDPTPIPFLTYPAAYNNVIGVSATALVGGTEQFDDDFNYGPAVDFGAPGANIAVLSYSGANWTVSGSSCSAPLVSALAGLIRSLNRNLSSTDINNILIASADRIDSRHSYTGNPPKNQYLGYGRINAYAALKYTIEHYSTAIGGQGVTVVFHDNISVASGTTLTVLPGTTVQFDAGKGLTSYGALIANGSSSLPIVFTASSSTWAGISIIGAGAANSSLQYVTIQNVQTYGGAAINVSASGVQVQHCTISNNVNYGTKGIYFSSAGSPDVSYNTLSGNGAAAVAFYNTNGYFYKNALSGSNGGVTCSNYASPSFGKQGFAAYNGNNKITTGSGGVYVDTYSSPLIGSQNNTSYGFNSIVPTSGYRVSANGNCYPLAEQNWWGSSSPSSSWFNAVNNSTIDWNPYLTYNPNPNVKSPMQVTLPRTPALFADTGGTVTPDAQLLSVINARASGDFSTAKSEILAISRACSSQPYSRLVAQEIMNLHRETKDPELFAAASNLSNEFTSSDPVIQTILANMLTDEGKRDAALSMYEGVASSNSGTALEKGALLGEFYLHFGEHSELSEATVILDRLEKSFAEDPDVLEARWVAGLAAEGSPKVEPKPQETSDVTSYSDRYELTAGYPNPFNPSTQIRFSLPVGANVSLAVFDVLGRQVALLASGHFGEGFHTLVWNASKLASGVYFARLQVTNDQGEIKFQRTSKLLLTK